MLYIIKPPYFMCSYVLGGLTDLDEIRILDYDKHKFRGLGRIKRLLRSYLFPEKRGLWLHQIISDSLLEGIAEITPSDDVLYFGMENLKDLRILTKEIEAKHQYVFMWNTVGMRYTGFLQKHDFIHFVTKTSAEVCTFDPHDAWWYGLKLVRQVYRRPTVQNTKGCLHSLFFIGNDKGRAPLLERIAQLCHEAKIEADFHILRDKYTRARCPSLARFELHELQPYSKVLEKIQRSSCLLEIVQEKQSGLSLRALEALFFEKKLITNNAYLRDCDFYNPNNIFIVTEKTSAEDIREFLSKAYRPISPDIIGQYDINEWIVQFRHN